MKRLSLPALLCWVFAVPVFAAPPGEPGAAPPAAEDAAAPAVEAPTVEAPTGGDVDLTDAVPLNPRATVLLDKKNGRLILKTRVCLREGLLEMFLCKSQTKEHESVLALDAEAFLVHAGLQVLGANPGSPARFDDQFHPPTGPKIDIFVNWSDGEGRPHRERAQTWVRHVTRRYYEAPLAALPAGVTLNDESELRYDPKGKTLIWFGPMTAEQRDALLAASDKAQYQTAVKGFFDQSQSRELEADWLFAGSGFFTDTHGTRWYQAEGGNIICVANFSDALLDLAVESSASNDNLLFEPYTERIPPLDAPVTLELIPARGADAQ